MNLSDRALSVWAKTGGASEWLPLVQHLSDTLWIAAYLYDHWVSRAVMQRWLDQGMSDGDLRALVLFLAGTHDIGKASPAFVAQCEPLAERARLAGLPCHTIAELKEDRKALPHSLISEYALHQWLTGKGVDDGAARALASVLGAHHGTPISKDRLPNARKRRNGTGGPAWREVRVELLDWLSGLSGFSEVLETGRTLRLPLPMLVEISGFVIVADWLASNTSLFPLRSRSEGGAVNRHMDERALRAWSDLAMPPPWEPPVVDLSDVAAFFRDRFGLPDGATPHAVQEAALRLAQQVEVGLMLIETATGGGKTEAALAVAEVLAGARGSQGVLVALPTQATTNAMFARVADWIDNLPQRPRDEGAWALTLGHGKARLNPRYARMSDEVRRFDHLFNTAASSGVHEENTDEHLCNAVVHQWFLSAKRRLLANFTVVTIDQVLMAALQRKHLMLAHLALSGKVVIIDEAHASDDFMLVYLESVLSWLKAYDVPVIVLSATLTAERRRELMRAYAHDRCDEIDALEFRDDDYPLVTVVPRDDGPVRAHIVEEPGQERRVSWSWHETSVDAIVRSVTSGVSGGGCAIVVRNTVKDAQATAAALAAAGLAVTLNHAGFIAADRAMNDLDLIHRFGKDSDAETREGQVVVATQVVEQSLDVDFDVLFTDLAPADLLLQRIGRLHRHQWRRRPPGIREARVYILVDRAEGQPASPTTGTRAVYGDYLLLRTAETLEAHGSEIVVPGDISPLVASALGGEKSPSRWPDQLAAARAKHDECITKARAKAATWCVRPWAGDSDERSTLGQWLATSNDFTELAMGAAVRDTEPTLEVLLIPALPDGSAAIHPPWITDGVKVLDVTTVPSDDVAREICTWSVRLPGRLVRGAIDEVIAAIDGDPRTRRWPLRRHPFLRSELLLFMPQTHEGSNTLCTEIKVKGSAYQVLYSPGQGIEVITP